MKRIKLTKDQIQKLALSAIGFVVLVYVYFNFFLGPLKQRRAEMLATTADLQNKVGSSKTEMAKASNLERQATTATTRYAAFKALNPEGAPIAWFPPRAKVFLANHHIDKAAIRLATNTPYKEPELAGWLNYHWEIDLPQTDFETLGKAIADLENSEPLLTIRKLQMHATPEDAAFQTASLAVNTAIIKQ
jgi:hypothetical protein